MKSEAWFDGFTNGVTIAVLVVVIFGVGACSGNLAALKQTYTDSSGRNCILLRMLKAENEEEEYGRWWPYG